MYNHAVYTLIPNLSGTLVRYSCAVLLLLLALHAEVSASPSPVSVSGHETLLPPHALATLTGSADYDASGVRGGGASHYAENKKYIFTSNTSARTKAAAAPAAETDSLETQAYKSVLESRDPDWGGIWRDTGVLFGAQFVAAGITLLAPESVSGWSPEEKRNSIKKYGNNFIHPVMDKDKLYINYILHPYWGATYYTRARERGFDKGSSFVFSALMSTLYEFGPECLFEKPSIQDLIVTPVAGSLLGAYIFEPWRESIKRKQELRWYDHAALVVTDPIGVLSLGFEKIFGIKPTVMIDYKVPQLQRASAGSAVASRSNSLGVVMQFPFN